ncbi:MAG: tyrosine-type recombinase/integrase [Nitrososphaerales archaeon]
MGHPEVLSSFRFPKPAFKIKEVLTKTELQKFYSFLPALRYRALFLFYASTGPRLMEVLELTKDDIELDSCMVRPQPHDGESKRSYLSFFNNECSQVLRKYLDERTDQDARLFPTDASTVHDVFKRVSKESEVKITPKKLRDWFCSEMGELGVPDRFVDAFCGRVPYSLLARHYTDYSPKWLKMIYDRAMLSILSNR